MFVNTLDPIIVSIGPLALRWYGLAYVVGFLATYWWLGRLAKKQAIKGLTASFVEEYLLWLMVGVVVGARVFEFLFFQPRVLLADPLEFFRVWHGGMSFHGGLAGAVVVTVLLCRKHKIDILSLGDALVLPAAFALFLGRIANFINSELPGKITTMRWCVSFPLAPDPTQRIGCRHPSQLYEALKNLLLLGILLPLWRTRPKKGMVLWSFILGYGVLRFIVNFWRDDPIILLGLSMGQLLCVVMIMVGGIGLFRTLYPKGKTTKKEKTY